MSAATPDPPVTPVSLEELIFRDVMPRIAHLQYAMAADQMLMVELLQDLARTNPNPARYLDGLYERVLARWEKSAVTEETIENGRHVPGGPGQAHYSRSGRALSHSKRRAPTSRGAST